MPRHVGDPSHVIASTANEPLTGSFSESSTCMPCAEKHLSASLCSLNCLMAMLFLKHANQCSHADLNPVRFTSAHCTVSRYIDSCI